jgi:FkbM family methyltransferase
MAFSRRLRTCSHWLAGRRNGVSPVELAQHVATLPCTVKARRHIVSVTDAGARLEIRLRGTDRPLFWPKGLDLYPLYMVIAETREPRDWHYYEVPETRVTADDVIADCGGAEGIFALYAAPLARHVYVIEPSPLWTGTLEQTFAGAANVTVVPAALGAARGVAYLDGGALDSAVTSAPDATDDRGGRPRVAVETLDALFYEQGRPLTYLKADLEGYELEMLAGGERTIAANLPKVAITTYHRAEHADAITDFLRRVDPRYQTRVKGIDADTGSPVMLHAWVPR